MAAASMVYVVRAAQYNNSKHQTFIQLQQVADTKIERKSKFLET